MNKREADTILLACKKHGLFLTMRKEGAVYFVIFINRIEIKSYEAAKLITNGLVIEGRHKSKVMETIYKDESYSVINFSGYPKRKTRTDDNYPFSERRRMDNE